MSSFPFSRRTALSLVLVLSLGVLMPLLYGCSGGPDEAVRPELSMLPEMPTDDHPLEVLVFGDSLYERFAHSTQNLPQRIRECAIMGHRFLGEVSFPTAWGDSLRHNWATNNIFSVGLRMRGFPNLNFDAVGLDGQLVGFYLDMGGAVASMETMVDTFLAVYGEPYRVRDTTFNHQGVRFHGPKRSWRTRTTEFWLTLGANEERREHRIEGGYFERGAFAVLHELDRKIDELIRQGHPVLDTTRWVGNVWLHEPLGETVERLGVEPRTFDSRLGWHSVYLYADRNPGAFAQSFLTLGDISSVAGDGEMIYDETQRPLKLVFWVGRAAQFRDQLSMALGAPTFEHECQRRDGTKNRVSMWFGNAMWIQNRMVANSPASPNTFHYVSILPRFD